MIPALMVGATASLARLTAKHYPADVANAKRAPSQMFRKAFWTSIFVLVGGTLLFTFDHLYGPKDEIIYLWPFIVFLLMLIALVVLLVLAFIRTYSALRAKFYAPRP
jgi:hypothetical protein